MYMYILFDKFRFICLDLDSNLDLSNLVSIMTIEEYYSLLKRERERERLCVCVCARINN